MPTVSGFARKYAIMEELDEGFGSGSTPEAFVRLDSWEGRIQASLNVKGLKQGPYVYKLYLIFAKGEIGDKIIPLPAGTLNISYNGMQGGLEIDADEIKSHGLKPESVRFAAITAESQDRIAIPLFSSFEKTYKWDESIRQVLLRKPVPENTILTEERPKSLFADNPPLQQQQPQQSQQSQQPEQLQQQVPAKAVKIEEKPIQPETQGRVLPQQIYKNMQQPVNEPVSIPHNSIPPTDTMPAGVNPLSKPAAADGRFYRCDINKLEGYLQNNFEEYVPFKRSSRGYSWYRVSDLAKLSNIMYQSGVNVPVFANPKILVGLFKFKHILAGLYRGDNGANYFVIGVPAKDDSDNKPFENACRWVPVNEAQIRDMGGYWLVYVSMKSGEIVV